MTTVKVVFSTDERKTIELERAGTEARCREVPVELLAEYERIQREWEAMQAKLAELLREEAEAEAQGGPLRGTEHAEVLRAAGWTVEEPAAPACTHLYVKVVTLAGGLKVNRCITCGVDLAVAP